MGNVLISEETLVGIADAIREKNGLTDLYTPSEMIDAIREISISSGEGVDPNKPVRFYGPYGDLVYSYSLSELNEMTELPILPEYKGLLGQSWNWSLDKVKSVNGEIEIGSLYITDDGETRIYVELSEDSLRPSVGFKQNFAKAVWVDWGDGTPLSTSDVYCNDIVSIEHEYAEPGNYVICLIPEESAEITLIGNSTGTLLLHKTPSNDSCNTKYSNSIYKIELGKGVSKLSETCLKSERLKSITITESIKSFGGAFVGCISLESITFPLGVTQLNRNEFTECLALEKILFSQNRVTSYHIQFERCAALKEVVISNDVDANICVFSQCSGLKRAVLPHTQESMSSDSFYNCKLLKEVIVRGNVTKINDDVFRACSLLEKVNVPDTVTTIGSYAFYSCFLLKDFRFPSDLVTIGNTAFGNCRSLKKVEIPKGVTSIESQAFISCDSIVEYRVYPTVPPKLGNSTSIFVPKGCIVYVPKGSLEVYQAAEYWSAFADSMIEMEE